MASQVQLPDTNPQLIAQAQLVRWRRRLGELTPEQELSIENLLTSTATKVSRLSQYELTQIILRENLASLAPRRNEDDVIRRADNVKETTRVESK